MENLVGKKAVGFSFTGNPTFTPNMVKYVGVIGKIILKNSNCYKIEFPDGEMYNYPYPEILKHLVEEEPEEPELTIDEILNNIKNIMLKM